MSDRCPKCHGEGRIANSDAGEPWSYWENLPPVSDLAVRMGFVYPIPCPVCGGKKADGDDRRLEEAR